MNNAPPIILDPASPCSPFFVPAAKTALLLLDFHTFIVNSQPDAGANVLTNAAALRSWAKSKGMLIIHCKIDFKAVTPANRKMAARANGVQQKMGAGGTAAEEAIAEPAIIAAASDEFVFYRPPSHVSALGSYGLKAFLDAHGVESLLLSGFSTSMCVLNTAKGAADEGFTVTLVEDACGDKDQEVHSVITKKVLIGQTHITELAVFTEKWDANQTSTLEALTDKLTMS